MQNEMIQYQGQRAYMRSPLASTINLNLEDELLSSTQNQDALMPLEN